jgi:hypothetical protein
VVVEDRPGGEVVVQPGVGVPRAHERASAGPLQDRERRPDLGEQVELRCRPALAEPAGDLEQVGGDGLVGQSFQRDERGA